MLIKIKIVYLVADLHSNHILLKDTQDMEESWILVHLTSMLDSVNNEGLTRLWLGFMDHKNVRVLTAQCVYSVSTFEGWSGTFYLCFSLTFR